MLQPTIPSVTRSPRDLPESEVHVWPVWLRADHDLIEYGHSLLSIEERLVAARHLAHLRPEYVLSHSVLRILLGTYLSVPPERIRYAFGSHGKPRLHIPGAEMEFNISHSSEIAVFAFARNCELGVDVERILNVPDMIEVARQSFCAAEAEELAALPVGEREGAFFRCWTRKEACLKAEGAGLSLSKTGFQVTLKADDCRIVPVNGGLHAGARWTLQDLAIAPGYAGAIAYKGRTRRLTMHTLREAGELLDEF